MVMAMTSFLSSSSFLKENFHLRCCLSSHIHSNIKGGNIQCGSLTEMEVLSSDSKRGYLRGMGFCTINLDVILFFLQNDQIWISVDAALDAPPTYYLHTSIYLLTMSPTTCCFIHLIKILVFTLFFFLFVALLLLN